MTKKLINKVALITGGSRGIGAAIAKRFAAEGASVAITYVHGKEQADSLVKSIKHEGGNAIAICADSANPQAITCAIQTVLQTFSALNILVNNAGVAVQGAIDDPSYNANDFSRQFAINVEAVAVAVRAAANIMSKGDRIISIGSTAGERTPFIGMSDYSATKAAIAGYTRGWARDLGAKGITVNIVQPGPINTDMNPENTDFGVVAKSMTALGRYGTPDEVAAAVTFLASEEASFITGATLNVDGGLNS